MLKVIVFPTPASFCHKLGYVSRRENKTIAKLMDKGILVKASIKEPDPEDHFMNAVKVEICYERPVSQ